MADSDPPSSKRWPSGGGASGALIAAFEPSTSPLGPADGWPPALRSAIELMLPAQVQMVLFWGPERIAFYNDAYRPTADRAHPAVLGRPLADHRHGVWHDLHDVLDRVWASGESQAVTDAACRIERLGVPQDAWFDLSCSALRDADGRVAGVLCVLAETTVRVRAAAALREAQAFTRLALDAARDGICAVDVHGTVTLANAAFARLAGLASADDAVGRPLHGLLRPLGGDGRADVPGEDVLDRALREGRSVVLADGRLRRADGSAFPGEGRVEPIRRDGAVHGAVCTFTDLSERIETQAALHASARAERDAAARSQQAASARARAESELKESERRLALAQAAGGIGVFSIDIATDRIAVSPHFCRLFGLPLADSYPASALEALSAAPHDAATRLSNAAERAAGTALLQTEYLIRRADDGRLRWISRRAEWVRDADGRPLQMLGAVQDVTEAKAAEDVLRRSEARFRTLAQAIPNQVWTARADGRLDWFNDKVFDYSGLGPDQLVGDGWATIVHRDDLRRVTADWSRAVATGGDYESELRIRRRDGAWRWHLVRGVHVDGGSGAAGWVGTNTDIDDQKAALAALATMNARLEERIEERTRERDRMWRLSTDLLLVARFDGTVVAANPAWQALLGWDESDLAGRSFLDWVHPDDLAATRAQIARLADGPSTLRFENRCRNRDGGWRHLSWTVVPAEGFLHAAGRDVSAEKVAAAALRDAEERLRQSQKMEAIGQLTGGIAHDFNNLLQGITGAMETVQRRIAQGRAAECGRFVDGALASARRAASLTHRLLAFSRRQPLDPRPLQVNPLIASMSDLLRRTLGEGIRLDLDLAFDLWPTLCDPNQLENALLNLAINARDAMPDGGRLTISTANARFDAAANGDGAATNAAAGREGICIAVADTGCGMTPEVAARAFEPFFTTKPIGQGTGLGLSMIYGFAAQSEGACRIDTAPGHGTTVRLVLPRCRDDVRAAAAGSAAPTPGEALAAAAPVTAGRTVLVVEDEPAVRALVVDVLAELGCHVLQAADGPSGLAEAERAAPIDLLVTDLGLPGLDGRRLADAARARRPGLKVLFMTGYAEQAAQAQGFLTAGTALIVKPFAIETLAVRLARMLGQPADASA